MITRSRLLLGLVLVLAVVLTFMKVPPASSQGLTVVAAQVPGDLPVTDPAADLWRQTTAVEVPLSAQLIAKPQEPDATVRSITVRALHNDTQLALLVEWADPTQDDQMVRVQDYRDAAAVQFPLAEGQPFFCMGQQGGDVNIWHWKADWQADMNARRDMESAYPNMSVNQYPFADPDAGILVGPDEYLDPAYLPALAADNLFALATHASPVEDLIAGGFGTLTSQSAEEQNVQGHGVWSDGQWRVIFSRDLNSGEAHDVTFAPEQVYSAAFAVWDGANGERNGQKSTSQWVSLQLGGEVSAQPGETAPSAESRVAGPLPTIFVMAFVLVVLVALVAGIFRLLSVREKEE